MKIKLFLLAALALIMASCTQEDAVETLRATSSRTVTITAAVSGDTQTRLAYDDSRVGSPEENAFSWESGDKLLLVGYDTDGNYKGKSVFTHTGTGNKFDGSPVEGAVKYKAYYPAEGTQVDEITGARQPFDAGFWGQEQASDGNVSHLTNRIVLSDETLRPLDEFFSLNMESGILKFALENIPAEVGTLKQLVWSVQTGTGTTGSVVLDFTPGAVTFSAAKQDLTAYLSFDPALMKIAAGDKVNVKLVGGRVYEYVTTVTNGKEYEPGKRYTAAINNGWKIAPVFRFAVRTTEANQLYNIKQESTSVNPVGLVIDWGDGTTPTALAAGVSLPSVIASHTYAQAGNYTITVTSNQSNFTRRQMQKLNFRGDSFLTAILDPLLNMDATRFTMSFYDCTSLTDIPEDMFIHNSNAKSFSGCFQNCTALTTVPEGLFSHNTGATGFGDCFRGCTALKTIPEGLFRYNTKATNFMMSFFNCTNLEEAPDNLFRYNTVAVNFMQTFQGCRKLKLNAGIFCSPEDVNFFQNRNMDFRYCFYNAGRDLANDNRGIAPRLWDYNRGTGTWRYIQCFYYANVTNSGDIPTGWK